MPSLFDPDPDTSDDTSDAEYDPDPDTSDDDEEDSDDDFPDGGDEPDHDPDDGGGDDTDEQGVGPGATDEGEPDHDPDDDVRETSHVRETSPEDPEDMTPAERVAEVFDLPRERPEPARLSDLVLEYKHWVNPRQFSGLDAEQMQFLADDILTKSFTTEDGFVAGIIEPLLVVKILGPNGKIIQLVIDGQRRYLAIQMAAQKAGGKLDDVWVKVRDREPDPIEWTEAAALKYLAEVLGAVGQRQGLSGYELSESASRLKGTTNPDTNKVYTVAQIAQRIGRSPSWVSKIFTARENASPKLLARWRKGEIPEETFRSLAAGVHDQEQQDKIADELSDKRKEGDKGSARRDALEAAERSKAAKKEARDKDREDKQAAKEAAKAKKSPAAPKGKGKGQAVKGPQGELAMKEPVPAPDPKPAPASTPEPSKPTKPKPIAFAVIEDWVEQAKRHPPTHDLVKGIVLGLQAATGMVDMANLPKPWHTYVLHLSGAKPVKKPGKKARKK